MGDGYMTVFNIICPDFLLTNRCNMACKYCFEKDKGKDDMDIDKLNEFMDHNPCVATFPFGGEPLLRMDLLCSIIDGLKKNPNINQTRRDKTIQKSLNVITNGTLLTDSILKKFKKYGFKAQISIDGPKHVQDENRIFPNGSGTYDTVMKGIDNCIKHGVNWSIHGVINKATIPYFYDIAVWFFELYKEKKDIDTAIGHMGKNTFQIIFEQDYDDEDIDILIDQFHKIAEYIYTRDYLTSEQKNKFFDEFFTKNGGVCSAGTTLISVDHNFDMYPCHRVALIPEKRKSLIGNVFKPFEMKNFRLLNSYYNIGRLKKYMYSAVTNIDNFKDKDKDTLRWFMWCPATNYQTSGTVYYQNAKYNLMFTELNRAIKKIRKAYYIKLKQKQDGSTRKQINSCRR